MSARWIQMERSLDHRLIHKLVNQEEINNHQQTIRTIWTIPAFEGQYLSSPSRFVTDLSIDSVHPELVVSIFFSSFRDGSGWACLRPFQHHFRTGCRLCIRFATSWYWSHVEKSETRASCLFCSFSVPRISVDIDSMDDFQLSMIWMMPMRSGGWSCCLRDIEAECVSTQYRMYGWKQEQG